MSEGQCEGNEEKERLTEELRKEIKVTRRKDVAQG